MLDSIRAAHGDASAVFRLSGDQLAGHGLSSGTIERLQSADETAIARDLKWLERDGRGLLTCEDPLYPALLRTLSDAPVALYRVGNPEILALPQLAIVGSRNPTTSGRETAAAFAHHMAGVGLSIVSGLANGIDAAAHQGALSANGHTVAICGTGLDQIYPASNRQLATDIAASGLLLSEYPVGTPPRRYHFPQRNRLISGISVGTLVVEAARKSGSLITARQAIEQGREVFAVPGSIHNPLARGCHQLLREGAKLVESAEDILDELTALVTLHTGETNNEVETEQEVELDADYDILLNALDYDPATVDTLINRSGLTAEAVSSMLLILELQGHVTPVSGGRYVRAREGKQNP
ncbi:MAG: DNA-processing protein DprA [Gammaproteobacteria bacterium]